MNNGYFYHCFIRDVIAILVCIRTVCLEHFSMSKANILEGNLVIVLVY